ncbi:hypothetical protein BT96DRAFT_914910 [Gymnopus androsaceus JB14]|uniref:Uncharacterized protein n=1 Tax=Gymnopus androsaceus JB14 TaxID=1447944 RepID=A0A6A4ICJ9_9AGAR|nr:hypothetical protein BT96DRAFT_914910 [Gymnopus androsaceus JB14]
MATSTIHCSTSDASSSSGDSSIFFDHHQTLDVSRDYPIVAEDQDPEYSSYDEFCMVLRGRTENDFEGDNGEHKPKKFSYVTNWRRRLDQADLTILVPPSPLFHSFDSPSSPVASVDPSRLCVTSSPHCEIEEPHAIIEMPTFNPEIYADLDEASASEFESSSSLPDPLPEVYIPKAARFKKVSSAIRWLPTRIKYSILSQTTHRK